MKPLCLLLAAGALLNVANSRAEIVYDNSSNYEGTFNDSRLEYGDQVNLAGDARLLTEFAFEYFASFAVSGDETARVRFYYNDGAEQDGLRAPGTLFYDSGSFTISSGYRTIRGEITDLLLESGTFTYTIEFAGLALNERAGLLNYDPPAIGSSGDYFWQKSGAGWEPVAVSGTGNNFAARFVAERLLKILGIARQGAGAALTISVTPGKAYALEYTTSLNGQWTRASSGTVRASSSQLVLQDGAADPMRIYRVIERNTTIRRSNTQATIVAFSERGRRYALEATSNLTDWTRLNTLNATGETVTFAVPFGSDARQFFRVVEL